MRRARKMTAIRASASTIKPGTPISSKNPVRGIVEGVAAPLLVARARAVDVICPDSCVCMAISVAGSVVTVTVAVFTAMTGVGLDVGVIGTGDGLGEARGVGGEVGVHRAASAVEVICWMT